MTTKTIPEHVYDKATPLSEAIEIHIKRRGTTGVLVLTAWRTGSGTVGVSLTHNGAGTNKSTADLQSIVPFPGKARAGWQTDVIAFAAGAAFGEIVEIR